MKKFLNNKDILFIASLTVCAFMLSIYLFTYPYLYDEAFYASIPYRLANGDSLIQHEWHLSQFSSLFSYLPVSIYLKIKGSTEGIIVFLRCIYFAIHTLATILIYIYFRKYKSWAIVAAMIFFLQVPYRIFSISYTSMYVLFTLFFVLIVLYIYKRATKCLCVLAGICFGCCCICNPLYSFAFLLYLLLCTLWKKRDYFKKTIIKVKLNYILKNNKNIHKKQRKRKVKPIVVFPNIENYTCFFCKNAIIYSFIGVVLTVIVAVTFYFSTGGTMHSLFRNIPNLLNSSEYNILSGSILSKCQTAYSYFSDISLNMPFMIPLLYIFLIFDKNRTKDTHKFSYLIIAITIAIIYMFGMFNPLYYSSYFFSLPFAFFSNVCYILTDKKNKTIFRCMWIPSLISALFQFISANSFLASLGIVFAVNNIAGVFFVRDLFAEINDKSNKNSKTYINKAIKPLLCIGICIQIFFQCFAFQYEQLPTKNSLRATSGPYAGIIMSESIYSSYYNRLSDLDLIKSINAEKNPILILSYQNWMYMYTDATIANYTTWRQSELFNAEQLIAYYKENPQKIPNYIYVDTANYFNEIDSALTDENIDLINKIFKFSKEELTSGVLLTVTGYNFELSD